MIDFVGGFAGAAIPPDAEGLRAQVKAFVVDQLGDRPAHVRARSWSGFDAVFSRALAKRGWVGLTLPRAYGGLGVDPFSRFVVVEELLIAGAPVAAHWIGDRQSGPLLLHYGTEEQRRSFLPRICKGEIFFCIGMSEPNSGSDLASVQTNATTAADGGWVLNGQKIWTTYAHKSDYMIALVRTSGTAADRQTGLSQFIIDLRLPGITIRPITDLNGDTHFNEVFFEEVRLPAGALVGKEGEGWSQVNAELAFERSGPERIYSSVVLLNLWIDWLQRTPLAASMAAEVGQLIARAAVLREMSISITARLALGEQPITEAALIKDLGTGFEQLVPEIVLRSIGSDPDLPADPELARTLAFTLQISPTFSLRGGTREILRGMIARGLGMR